MQLVGVVYLDLFERPNKFHGGAAFVVQCQPMAFITSLAQLPHRGSLLILPPHCS